MMAIKRGEMQRPTALQIDTLMSIAKQFAAIEPVSWADFDVKCIYCAEGEGTWQRDTPLDHEPNCPWLAAKKIAAELTSPE